MDIINIGNFAVNNYLVHTQKGWIAIDTGYAGSFERYCKQLKERSISLTDIKYIILTHAHDDHAGFLSELLKSTQAQLILHDKAPGRLLTGHNQWIGGCSGLFAKVFVEGMRLVGKAKHEFPAIDVRNSATVWDGSSQPLLDDGIPIKLLYLPGHTVDSIGLLLDTGELFCGDAAMNGFPSNKRNIIWIENLDDYSRSWDRMIDANAQMIYPSHGKPFPASDLKQFRKYHNNICLR